MVQPMEGTAAVRTKVAIGLWLLALPILVAVVALTGAPTSHRVIANCLTAILGWMGITILTICVTLS